MSSNHISDICLILFFILHEQLMGFQDKSSFAIFIPETNPLLIHMMKTSIVGNVIRRPLARPGLSACFSSLNL